MENKLIFMCVESHSTRRFVFRNFERASELIKSESEPTEQQRLAADADLISGSPVATTKLMRLIVNLANNLQDKQQQQQQDDGR